MRLRGEPPARTSLRSASVEKTCTPFQVFVGRMGPAKQLETTELYTALLNSCAPQRHLVRQSCNWPTTADCLAEAAQWRQNDLFWHLNATEIAENRLLLWTTALLDALDMLNMRRTLLRLRAHGVNSGYQWEKGPKRPSNNSKRAIEGALIHKRATSSPPEAHAHIRRVSHSLILYDVYMAYTFKILG